MEINNQKRILSLCLTTSLFFFNLFGKIEPKTQKNNIQPIVETQETKVKQKEWNFMVYFASNNDLYQFSLLNIHQMLKIGSNKNINILIQQDTYGKKGIFRFFVEKNNLVLKEKIQNTEESTSGTPKSLFKFAEWCIKNYQAKHHALILWNHGSGIEDPSIWGKKLTNKANNLYSFNPQISLLELNRKFINDRGIAFNTIFETYLTNQDLKNTLQKISSHLLKNKKIDILGMDACNMAMLEVGSEIKDYVNYMVGSEEVEPGTGWEYSKVLKPFKYKSLTPSEFAIHIVKAYGKEYQYQYADTTQSAICLKQHQKLEKNINNISINLLNLLSGIDENEIIKNIKKIRTNKKLTTEFANKNYIDMHHFYTSLLETLNNISQDIKNKKETESLIINLQEGIDLIEKQIIENSTNINLPKAKGLSFYFPTKKIHKSYYKTTFAQNWWINFLEEYIKKTKPSFY